MMSLSLVSYGDSDSDNESKDAKPESDVRKLLVVSSRRGPVKQKGPVKIGLPTFKKQDDSDSEDELPQVKRKKQSSRSGLTALLPAPKGGGKELGSGKKSSSTTKTMVPYTLSKRYQDTKKKNSAKRTKLNKKSGEDDSDSDGDVPVSFFSLESTPSISKPAAPTLDDPVSEPKPQSETQAQSETYQPSSSVGPSQPHQYSYTNYSGTPHTNEQYAVNSNEQYAIGSNEQYSVSANQQYSLGSNEQYAVGSNEQYAVGSNEQYACVQDQSGPGYSGHYPTAVTQDPSQAVGGRSESSVPDTMSAVGPGLSIDQDQLRRLAGVKRGKNREEGLNNITEIREDDVKESIKTFQKYHTEDTVNKYFQNEASKMTAPTGQQKRKHQLTFLAHQAKANELELSKHWAQSAATRRQSKMKYGF